MTAINLLNTSTLVLTGCVCSGLAILLASVCLHLFLTFRKRIAALSLQVSSTESLESKLAEAGKVIDALTSRMEEIERRRTVTIDGNPEPESVNLNRRGQVLRLHRKGDSPGQIASALGLSQGEVRLTLKLHDMVLEKSSREIPERSL